VLKSNELKNDLKKELNLGKRIQESNFFRFREIIDDWHAFIENLSERKPSSCRVNTLKTAKKELIESLKEFDSIKEVSWYEDALVFENSLKPGNTLEHALGYYYIQDLSSMIPVLALSPKENELIVDLCASPGSKTTQIAQVMKNTGTIIANEVYPDRIQKLIANIYRFGALNTVVVQSDARNFFLEERKADRILVDAPCSSLGNLKKHLDLMNADKGKSLTFQATQIQLLRKAIKYTETGGTIVYSTCTVAPEENEEVVNALLGEGSIEIEKIELNAVHAKGLTEFEGKAFDSSLSKTIRIYPHHFNSGGMFIAKLRKIN